MELTHEQAVEALGFSEKESRVYIALLGMGIGSAVGIASKANIKRPTAYVVLDELIKKGAVFTIPRSKKKLYRATPAQNLFELYETRFKKAKGVLPEIQAISKQESYKARVFLYEGVEGVKESLMYGTKELAGKTLRGFSAKGTPEILRTFENFEEHNNLLKKLGIRVRGIVPHDASVESFRKKDAEYNRTMKEVPNNTYSSDVSIEIGDTFVRFFDPVNLQALVIENPAITKTMGEIFEMTWASIDDK